ncbi:PREDICTED: uncharacterized protein LOC106815612 [Priapulus caudatus]|uniref:Uncharacterized protein LOC106815612 n=1 Tax=Priapulus caudatus TaxID=37621 RepID=A0ABM1ETR2_PRICU|nr:PREDICTED: uncharacterized protein LOC106815612 [Priapulus caudatus]
MYRLIVVCLLVAGQLVAGDHCSGSFSRGPYSATWDIKLGAQARNDAIEFTISHSRSDVWLGVGFKLPNDNSMPNTDFAYGFVMPNGQTVLIDSFISGYGRPTTDEFQNVNSVSSSSVPGRQEITFTKSRKSVDDGNFPDLEGKYLVFPASPGRAGLSIHKHQRSPIVSNIKLEFNACRASSK